MTLTLKDALQNVGDFAQEVATPQNFKKVLGAFAGAGSPRAFNAIQQRRLAEEQFTRASQAEGAKNQLGQITSGIGELDKIIQATDKNDPNLQPILKMREAAVGRYTQLTGQPWQGIQSPEVLAGAGLAAQRASEGVTEQNTIEREQRAEQARIEAEGRALQTKVGAENRAERADIREERRKEQATIRAEGRKTAVPKRPITMLFPDGSKKAYRPSDPKVDEAMAKGATVISQQASGPPGTFTGTKTQMGKDVLQRDFLNTTLKGLNNLIDAGTKDKTILGALGSVRATLQSTAGIATDIGKFIGQETVDKVVGAAREIVDTGQTELTEADEFLNNPNVSNLRLFEESLGIALARLSHDEGRVPVDTIRRSIKNVQLTGLKSSQDVLNRLKQVKKQLEARLKDTNSRLGASKDKRIRFDSSGNMIP